MAEQNPPIFIQAGTHPAEDTRRALSSTMYRKNGIHGSTDLAVTEKGVPNMSVDVAIGAAWILGTQATFQGMYYVENRTATNVVITAAHATLARKDLIVAKVEDAGYSGVVNAWSLACVAGTAAASPAEPAVPSNAIVLAMVDIPALDTAITNSQITDRRITTTGQGRAAALGGVIVATSSARPTGSEGMVIYETDTDRLKAYDGSTWQNVASYPLLWARKTATESVTSSTVSQNDDALLLSVVASCVYKVEAMIIYDGAAAGDIKFSYTVPAGAVFNWSPYDLPLGATVNTDSLDTQHLTTGTSSSGAIGTGTNVVVFQRGVLIMGGSSGSLQLQWAQDTSSGTATRVIAGSWISAQRVE